MTSVSASAPLSPRWSEADGTFLGSPVTKAIVTILVILNSRKADDEVVAPSARLHRLLLGSLGRHPIMLPCAVTAYYEFQAAFNDFSPYLLSPAAFLAGEVLSGILSLAG